MADKKKTVEAAAPASDKKKALDTAIAQIEKDFGKGSIMRLGENSHIVVEAIPTGSLSLDIRRLDPSVRDYEPHIALDGGEDGLKFYRAVAKKWKCALKNGGKLIFEVGYDQARAVEAILAEQGFTGLHTTMDPGLHWRVVEGRIEA